MIAFSHVNAQNKKTPGRCDCFQPRRSAGDIVQCFLVVVSTFPPVTLEISVNRLLFDQNLSPRLVNSLNSLIDLYSDSNHVFNLNLDQTSDNEVWDFALDRGFAIVTKDADFGDLSLLIFSERASAIPIPRCIYSITSIIAMLTTTLTIPPFPSRTRTMGEYQFLCSKFIVPLVSSWPVFASMAK